MELRNEYKPNEAIAIRMLNEIQITFTFVDDKSRAEFTICRHWYTALVNSLIFCVDQNMNDSSNLIDLLFYVIFYWFSDYYWKTWNFASNQSDFIFIRNRWNWSEYWWISSAEIQRVFWISIFRKTHRNRFVSLESDGSDIDIDLEVNSNSVIEWRKLFIFNSEIFFTEFPSSYAYISLQLGILH